MLDLNRRYSRDALASIAAFRVTMRQTRSLITSIKKITRELRLKRVSVTSSTDERNDRTPSPLGLDAIGRGPTDLRRFRQTQSR